MPNLNTGIGIKPVQYHVSHWKGKQHELRNTPYSLIGIFYNIKASVLPNYIYRFNVISVKISKIFFGCQQTDSKIYREKHKTKNS